MRLQFSPNKPFLHTFSVRCFARKIDESMIQSKIFVADDVKGSGLEPLRLSGCSIEKRTGLTGQELHDAIRDCEGLIVRSETKVTAEVMDAAKALRVIGRAGVGVDNIDVPAATARGIVVMNAPDGNTITTAEHTVAMMVALARYIPQANLSLKENKWERKKFVGVELQGKTLGVVGLGRIGRVVSQRARAFGMKVVAYDPFVSADNVRDLEIDVAPLDEVIERADFLTVHTPMTPETTGIIGPRAFSKMKRGVRIINCARGGLVDEAALYKAIKEGIVAGAALDVFEQEPPAADNPLLSLDQVIVTPHLGASTTEAQEGVAVTVAEQMRDFLENGNLHGAVNLPAIPTEDLKALRPYFPLSESLGRLQGQLVSGNIKEVRLEFAGDIAELDAAPVTRAFVAGLLRNVSTRINAVNAFLVAEERGINITTSYVRGKTEGRPAIKTIVASDSTEHVVSGILFGLMGGQTEGRVTQINDFHIEAQPQGHLLMMRNRDMPGVIGKVGAVIGDAGVNISRFNLGRKEQGGDALALIETDASVNENVLEKLRAIPEVVSVQTVEL
jgi:D-3-phosphoglycerate dehydrogenase